jgi:hypothetical protein
MKLPIQTSPVIRNNTAGIALQSSRGITPADCPSICNSELQRCSYCETSCGCWQSCLGAFYGCCCHCIGCC